MYEFSNVLNEIWVAYQSGGLDLSSKIHFVVYGALGAAWGVCAAMMLAKIAIGLRTMRNALAAPTDEHADSSCQDDPSTSIMAV